MNLKIIVPVPLAFGLAACGLTLAGCGGGASGPTVPANTAQAVASVPTPTPTIASSTGEGTTSPDGHVSVEMIGNSMQMAPVYECWYALRQGYLNTPDTTGPGGAHTSVQGNWNYIGSDTNAFNVVYSVMRDNSSVSSFFGTGSNYGTYGGYGRGGQCTYFATVILKRCRNYSLMGGGWSYGTAANANCPAVSSSNTRAGDIIYYNNSTSDRHVAVAVLVDGTGIDVVDSNYFGYGNAAYRVGTYAGVSNSEIVSRHHYNWSDLANRHFKVYSGNGRWYGPGVAW